jgi:hypothetical protein
MRKAVARSPTMPQPQEPEPLHGVWIIDAIENRSFFCLTGRRRSLEYRVPMLEAVRHASPGIEET